MEEGPALSAFAQPGFEGVDRGQRVDGLGVDHLRKSVERFSCDHTCDVRETHLLEHSEW